MTPTITQFWRTIRENKHLSNHALARILNCSPKRVSDCREHYSWTYNGIGLPTCKIKAAKKKYDDMRFIGRKI